MKHVLYPSLMLLCSLVNARYRTIREETDIFVECFFDLEFDESIKTTYPIKESFTS